MELIVDANILFASLIKNSTTAALLTRNDLILFTPEFVFAEFRKHENEILLKTKRNSDDFRDFLLFLETRIQLVAREDVAQGFREQFESLWKLAKK
ncbi:MAG: PIN domain-containing protein [Candidatus Woesearchaeota archaeon]